MKIQKMIQNESIRMQTYHVLSQGFHFPEKGVSESFRIDVEKLHRIDPEPAPHTCHLKDQLKDVMHAKNLVIEYTRLFIGPYSLPAPPYGSVYLDPERTVMGDSTVDVETRYSRFGIKMADGFHDMPDHIAAELEFMLFLIHKELDSILCNQTAAACDILMEQQSFINNHLNAWVPEFVNRVNEHAKTSFYRQLAKALHGFITDDAAYVNQIRIPVTES